MNSHLPRLTAIAATLLLSGCTRDATVTPAPERKIPPVALRIQLAGDKERAGYTPMQTKGGESVFVDPQVEFDNRDVLAARALHGERRTILQIVLNSIAADRLRRMTRAHIGERLAIFIDGELVSAAYIRSEVTGGEIRVFGRFSDERVEEIAAGLLVHQ